jgi:signal transduction histidine kinase
MVGDRPFGMLAMAFAQPIAFHSVEEELILALAQQIALVLQLTLLSEADKQSAIAREQEQAAQERAAELAKANEALKRSLDALASEPSLDKFLGQVLGAIAEQFDSPLAEYWYHPADTAYIGMMSWQGRVYSRDEIATTYPNHSGVVGHTVPPEQVQGESLQHRKQYFITEDWDTNPFTNYERWYPEHGFHKEINVPMVLGDECIGALVVRLPRGYQITTQQIELAQALAHQATLAVQLTRLAEEVKQAAILEERNRMARDIHDTLAQSFTGIIMQLETLKGNAPIASDDIQTRLDRVSDLARLGLTEARRSVQALRPQALEAVDFAAALRHLLHQFTHDTPICATLNIEGASYPLPDTVEENLLRIAQEALTNAIRHGHAHTITLQLLFEPAVVHLQISDDGNGFDPHSILPTGFGLVGMQERTLHLNGHFHLASHPGQGTEITVTVPL